MSAAKAGHTNVGHYLKSHWFMPSLVFYSMILILNLSYGFQHLIERGSILRYFTFGSFLFVACGLALAALTLAPAKSSRQPDSRLLIPAAATGFTLISVLSSIYFNSAVIPLPIKPLLISIAALTVVLGFTRRMKEALWFLAALGTVLFVYLTLSVPMDVKAANMLPIIEASCRSMSTGVSPFLKSYPEIASAPMYYLALNVLPYCPFEWGGIDIRWLNVAVFLTVLWFVATKLDFLRTPELAGLTFLPFLLSPMVIQMGYNGHVWPYWLCAMLLAFALSNEKYRAAAFLLGLMLLTRQMALFVAGMLGAAFVANAGWKQGLRYSFIAFALFAAGMVATQIYSGVAPQDFFLAIKAADSVTHAQTSNPSNQISISGSLVALGLRNTMFYFQAVAAALLCALFLKSGRLTRWQVAVLLGLGYMTAISFSVYLHRYFYGSGILMVAAGMAFAFKESIAQSSYVKDSREQVRAAPLPQGL